MQENIESLTENIVEAIVQGANAAAIRGLSPTQLEAVYGLGSILYEQKKFEQAEQVFAWLVREKPVSARFLKALGAARQMMQRYEPALDAYGLAAVLDLDDPTPSLHAAECLLHLKEVDRAREALDAASEQAGGEHPETREKIAILRKALPNEPSNKGNNP